MHIDLKILRDEIDASFKDLEPFREKRLQLLNQVAGYHYNNETDDKTPVNMFALAAEIYLDHLAAKSPAVMVTSPKTGLGVPSINLKLALNHLLEEIGFKETMESVIMNALVGLSPVRIGLNQSSTVEMGGVTHDVGQPFVDALDLSDWVHDMSARNMNEVSFCGHRYRMTKTQFIECGLFENVEHVQTTDSGTYSNTDDDDGAHTLSQNNHGVVDTKMEQTVEMWDIWLPRQGTVVSIQPNNTQYVFREVEWDGPETGPYRFLAFRKLPNNIMPLPPFSQLLDLQQTANTIFNKLTRQTMRQKTVGVVRTGSQQDGKRLKEAQDGDIIASDDPNAFNEIKTKGMDQETLMFFLQSKGLFTYLAGNLDTLGGLKTQADTLGQEELLSAGASKKIRSMEQSVFDFVVTVLRDLAYYLWTDPLISIPLVKRVGGRNGVDIPILYTPESREGDFLDYSIRIEPYSMQYASPREKFQKVRAFVQEMVSTPLLEIATQQGLSFDVQQYVDLFGEYENVDELKDIFIRSTPPPLGQQPLGAAAAGGGTTNTTNNITRNPKGGQSFDSKMLESLQAGGRPRKEDVPDMGDLVV